LVRSTSKSWSKGSVLAVDAGTHLSSIIRILERPSTSSQLHSQQLTSDIQATQVEANEPEKETSSAEAAFSISTDNPFYGAPFPFETPRANAVHVIRDLISTYLITHAHLDHISGFVINTPAFQHTSRPKKLAALPATINAIKTHIFNNTIWPNLSDESGGVGLVSYMRLVDGGSLALGAGDGRGYVEVCEGLTVKSWSVSHGHKMTLNSHRDSNAGMSNIAGDDGSFDSQLNSAAARRASLGGFDANSLRGRADAFNDRESLFHTQQHPVYDSSAFFIRDEATGKEILVFGDVEPDSISLTPRTAQVWSDAAPKIARGLLTGVFIECSYDDSQPDEVLFGHLSPRHVMDELRTLAHKVSFAREHGGALGHGENERAGFISSQSSSSLSSLKRKRLSIGAGVAWDLDGVSRSTKRNGSSLGGSGQALDFSRASTMSIDEPHNSSQEVGIGGGLRLRDPFASSSSVTSTARADLASSPAISGLHHPSSTTGLLSPTTTNIASPSSTLSHYPPAPTTSALPATDPQDLHPHRSSSISGVAAPHLPDIECERAIERNHLLQKERQRESGEGGAGGHEFDQTPARAQERQSNTRDKPLRGLKVVLIHVKDTLRDGQDVGDIIMEELKAYEEREGLGCEFILSTPGGQVWL
jgi:cAMP phosphodiesterase